MKPEPKPTGPRRSKAPSQVAPKQPQAPLRPERLKRPPQPVRDPDLVRRVIAAVERR